MGNNEWSQPDNEYMVKFRNEIDKGGIKMTYSKMYNNTTFLNQSSIPVYFKCKTGTSFIPSSTREMTLLHSSCSITVPLDSVSTYIIAPFVTYPYNDKSLHQAKHFGTIRVPNGEEEYTNDFVLRSI